MDADRYGLFRFLLEPFAPKSVLLFLKDHTVVAMNSEQGMTMKSKFRGGWLLIVQLFGAFCAIVTGSTVSYATSWKIDMDEIVCRSEAIVVGIMDKPTEVQRQPYSPGDYGRSRVRITFSAQLEVTEVLWGHLSLRPVEIRSRTIDRPDFVPPANLRPPGGSRPVGRQAIWFLDRTIHFPHWSVIYVSEGSPDRFVEMRDRVGEIIKRNTACLQVSRARVEDNGDVFIRLQLELHNPTQKSLGMPGFGKRNQDLHSQLPVRVEWEDHGAPEPKGFRVVTDSTVDPSALPPGSRRIFGIDYLIDGDCIGYVIFGKSLRITIEGYGSTNWIRRIQR
jgi:hypothetical protein